VASEQLLYGLVLAMLLFLRSEYDEPWITLLRQR
jgi:hypothetical protein